MKKIMVVLVVLMLAGCSSNKMHLKPGTYSVCDEDGKKVFLINDTGKRSYLYCNEDYHIRQYDAVTDSWEFVTQGSWVEENVVNEH